MTSLTTKLTIAAAALFAAGAASAQTLKADIPFAFQSGSKVMAAGTYNVDLRGPAGTVVIRNSQRSAEVLAMPTTHIEGKGGTAKLIFSCGHGPCYLVQAWSDDSASGLAFRAPKRDAREEAWLTVVPMQPADAQ
jgi:CDP-diacylglycerol pyrophosphatase